MADFEGAARATAEWWADKVFGSAVAPVTTHADPMGGIALAAMSLLKDASPVDTEKREAYVVGVSAWVLDCLSRQVVNGSEPRVTIMTDYGASSELRHVDQRLGIPGARYPSKSITFTYGDHVVASFGYQGQHTLIWAEEGWEHPPCHQGQWDLSTPRGGRLPFKCSAPRYHPTEEHVFDIPDPLCQGEHPYEPGKVCNQPRDADCHKPDGWMRWVHEFVE